MLVARAPGAGRGRADPGARAAQVEPDEYNQFFKATFREFMDPLATAHFNVEGTIEFSALLFVPGMAPFEQQARTPPEAAGPPRESCTERSKLALHALHRCSSASGALGQVRQVQG